MKFFARMLLVLCAFTSYTFGQCPDPQQTCKLFHGPNAVATAYCSGATCSEMNYGESLRLHVIGDYLDFPDVWFVWPDGELVTPPAGISCSMRDNGNKTRVQIPENQNRCLVRHQTDNHLYAEHFVSNPASGCVAWLECKLN